MNKILHKTIIFTKTPINGFFRYKDIFQIYPANFKNMPKSNLQQHHPTVLEYWLSDDDKIDLQSEDYIWKELSSNTATILTKQDKILSLLTVFTNHIFFRYNDLTGSWGLPLKYDNPGEEMLSWSTKWIMPDFYWPEMIGIFQNTEFSNPIVPEIKFIEVSR
ncbi:MAG: hypothetical protein KKE39_00510 [Bacteroidetes bacterium]|nr:hypothetical protein [Bacteroidota bacterium]MBU1372557.1 hypothetical protein [Bacteroidota bacterium]MBU1485034.1 hypothetical protein [Bacteroidota bacterium]MBU1760052.1 hypothetical protein [Bacteroidota bacterium]MBU2269321.1 hypothetical protein [Bacteroidota bacterium]